MPAQNGITDDEFVTAMPPTGAPEDELAQERSLARFSRSAEYRRLEEHMQERITYHQRFMPGTNDSAVHAFTNEQRGEAWAVANAVIGEFEAVLAAYRLAAEAVEKADVRPEAA